jgi:hypothetical protein
MNTSHFNGVWTAIATPFLENGSIDWPAFEKHLTQQAAGGVSGIVISGTTGEAPPGLLHSGLKLYHWLLCYEFYLLLLNSHQDFTAGPAIAY